MENDDAIDEIDEGEGFTEIKMGGGWYLTIALATSEKYDKEYVEIAKERSGQKKGRFNLNPRYVRELGEALTKFADDNDL
ncbi:conserved hypothetical protein [Methanohalobium evestigatum Z-7303]|uniref:Uncharacterized protein n=1 Tax=Methanohalobium evestigatum (strain ATCC BAA-1072 / DSM 3721 / NBRC 107634 / OCM 161 / Z-7303) TaxID=644295 RepID=D7E7G8_METEZ|nr:hypothetical protein [Methanohalobium evestigatum]ADI73917.1 conserved hypothetical protein [Methanohalobium evestigatum Z-7303]